MGEKKLLTARLDISLIDRLRESAKAKNVSMTEILETLIEGYLDGNYTLDKIKGGDNTGDIDTVIDSKLDSVIDDKLDGIIDSKLEGLRETVHYQDEAITALKSEIEALRNSIKDIPSSPSNTADNSNELADEVARLSHRLEQMQSYFGLFVPVPSDDKVNEPDKGGNEGVSEDVITKSDTDEGKDADWEGLDYDYSKFNSDEAIKESIEIEKTYSVPDLASILGISTNAIYQWTRGKEVGSSFDKKGYSWEVVSTDPQTLKVTAKL